MNYLIKPPKIEYIGTDSKSILKSWVDSRSKFLKFKNKNTIENIKTGEQFDVNKYSKEVMNMDLAFNYFQSGIFKMSTSILIRDFFYTFQEYKGKWATTQRYSTQEEMIASSEMNFGKIDKVFELFKEATENYNNGNITQFDHVRELMPLAYQVNWQCSMPIKQFIKILATLLNIVGKDSIIWKEMWSACYKCRELREWLPKILKYTNCDESYKYSLENISKIYPNNIVDVIYKDIGNVGSVLYSQLIRHEDTFVLGYPEFIKRVLNNEINLPNCKEEFSIKLYQSKQRELEMLRVRTSWWAVTDDWNSTNTWAKILKYHIPENAQLEDYKKYFSCFDEEGNYDSTKLEKHKVDDSLRLHKGYNTYFPSAFQLECRDIIEQRIKRYGNNPLLQLYLQFFDKGYVKDNPNNLDRIKWEKFNE